MKILYIALSCNPYKGSEDQIGWNIPYYSNLIGNKIIVITTKDQEKYIEKFCKENNFFDIKFYYIDIPKKIKRILNKQLFSIRLLIYNKKAYKIAKKICYKEKIDIIHQITPIEFRAIGKYYKIKNTKFIVGPVGGGSATPKQLKKYVPIRKKTIELIRTITNITYSMKFKILKKINKIDCLLCSNYETMKYLNKVDDKYIRIELGYNEDKPRKKQININSIPTFLVPGRLIFIKGHRFLLDALKLIPSYYKYKINIVGDGEDYNYLKNIILKNDNLKEHVFLIGKVDYEKMPDKYVESDAVLLTSIRENCCTTMLEALSYDKPVVSLKMTGMALLNNEKCGRFIEGKTNHEMCQSLANIIVFFINNHDKLSEIFDKCYETASKYKWDENIKYYNNIYKNILK